MSPLKDLLREYDSQEIIDALGKSDVLDAISAHDIMDHICYLVRSRPELKRSQIFRIEVLGLAARLT